MSNQGFHFLFVLRLWKLNCLQFCCVNRTIQFKTMIYDVNSPLFRSFLSQKGGSSDKRSFSQFSFSFHTHTYIFCVYMYFGLSLFPLPCKNGVLIAFFYIGFDQFEGFDKWVVICFACRLTFRKITLGKLIVTTLKKIGFFILFYSKSNNISTYFEAGLGECYLQNYSINNVGLVKEIHSWVVGLLGCRTLSL